MFSVLPKYMLVCVADIRDSCSCCSVCKLNYYFSSEFSAIAEWYDKSINIFKANADNTTKYYASQQPAATVLDI